MNDIKIQDKEKVFKLAWEYRQNQALLSLIINDIRSRLKDLERNLHGLYDELKGE